MKVLIAIHHAFELWNAPDWLRDRMQQSFPQVHFVQLDSFENLKQEIEDAEVLLGWQLRAEQFAEARKLRWIHATTAAVHQLLFPELVASDVRITNSADIHGPVVAEHAIALIFAMAKGVPTAVRDQAAHRWGQQDLWRTSLRPREIRGATLVLVGLGAIGKECVKLAKALGMRVHAVRQRPELGAEGADRVFGTGEIKEALAEADYVLLAAALTPNTASLFNDNVFAGMRSDACFLNVSRGELVDEAALERALRQNKIRAAALDVFITEPLPGNSPLWDLENLLITPHTAALTDKLWERHFVRFSENLGRYIEGRPLLGEISKQKGY